jgi:hypothetical protein
MDSQCPTSTVRLAKYKTTETLTQPTRFMDSKLREAIAGMTPDDIQALIKKLKSDVEFLETLTASQPEPLLPLTPRFSPDRPSLWN